MPAPAYYAWGADWMPLAIQLTVPAIEGINRAISAARRAEPGRDTEIGGILLGTVDMPPGGRPVVRVMRFDQVESEHRRGSSYFLSDRDKRVVARKLDWWNRHRDKEGLQPVGFFRTHTRSGLYVDNDDFAVFQKFFPEQTSVYLLVRPIPGADSVAGLYFWERGDMHRETSYQEFAFNPAQLPLTMDAPATEPLPEVTAPADAAPPAAVVAAPEAAPADPPRVIPKPRTMPLPPPAAPPPRGRTPVWLQIAIPLIVGVTLGAVVFK